MRVLLVSHHAPPHIGGVETLVQMQAEALLDAGHDVTWVTSDGGGAGAPPPAHPRLRVLRVRAWHGIERRWRIAYPLYAPSLLRRLWTETRRADLVHVHGLVFLGSPVAAVFARWRGVPCLLTDHGGLLRYPSPILTGALRLLIATLGRVTARCASNAIAYNGEVLALLSRLVGDSARVRLLPNPGDFALFTPPTEDDRASARRLHGFDDRPHVLCVARLLPHKGIDVLLAASDPSRQLVFCGPADDDMRARIRSAGAICLPPRPRHELPALYHACDVFALPSHNEGFPVAVQEALACGLPVLTTASEAYAAYRDTPGLHFCEPTPDVVAARLCSILGAARSRATPSPSEPAASPHAARDAWLRDLLAPVLPRADARPPC